MNEADLLEWRLLMLAYCGIMVLFLVAAAWVASLSNKKER